MKSKIELMNIVAITSKDVVTVKVKFHNSTKQYIYLCRKELATQLEKGDKVLVEANDSISTVKVHEVEDLCNLPNIDQVQYKWLFGKVPTDDLEAIKEWQKSVAETLHNKQIQHMQTAVLAEIGITNVTEELPKLSHKTPPPSKDD